MKAIFKNSNHRLRKKKGDCWDNDGRIQKENTGRFGHRQTKTICKSEIPSWKLKSKQLRKHHKPLMPLIHKYYFPNHSDLSQRQMSKGIEDNS